MWKRNCLSGILFIPALVLFFCVLILYVFVRTVVVPIYQVFAFIFSCGRRRCSFGRLLAEKVLDAHYRPLQITPLAASAPPYTVAVIGAGWVGLQAAKELRQRGLSVRVFEVLDDVGGTWNAQHAYLGQHIHSAGWLAEFLDFSLPEAVRGQRMLAPEMAAYCRAFFNHFELYKITSFHSRLIACAYDSKTRKCTLTIENQVDRSMEQHGGFDLVVYTSCASHPFFPSWPGDHLYRDTGRLIHCKAFSADVLAACRRETMTTSPSSPQQQRAKHIVVVGGNKSACDILVQLHDANYPKECITWLSRSDYQFCCYETIFHGRTILGRLRGHFCVFGLGLAALSPALSVLFFKCIGMVVQPQGWHMDQRKFHLGNITNKEYSVMRTFVPRVRDEIDHFTEHSIVLKRSKAERMADLVVCATGYSSGWEGSGPTEAIRLTVDGTLLDQRQPLRVFEGTVLIDCPGLLFSNSNLYIFGIKRGVAVADHIISLLNRKLTADEMSRSPYGCRGGVLLQKSALFEGKHSLVQQQLILYHQLWAAGLHSVFAVRQHFLNLFVENSHTPLQFVVSSSQAAAATTYVVFPGQETSR